MASAYSSSSSVSAQTIGGTSSWTEKSSIWDCGPDVGHRQAGNRNVLAQYLMTNIFKMVSWKKALHALEADSFIHVHVHTYLIYILNSNCTWIASNKPFGIVTEHLLLFINTTGSVFTGGGSDWYHGARILMTCSLIAIFLQEFALIGYLCINEVEKYRQKLAGAVLGFSAVIGNIDNFIGSFVFHSISSRKKLMETGWCQVKNEM